MSRSKVITEAKVIVIYGAKGSGKTTYAKEFKQYFGAERIIDDFFYWDKTWPKHPIKDGDLILTSEVFSKKEIPNAQFFEINQALEWIGKNGPRELFFGAKRAGKTYMSKHCNTCPYFAGIAARQAALDDRIRKVEQQRDELLATCELAKEWLGGWASAEPYLAIINKAIANAEGGAA